MMQGIIEYRIDLTYVVIVYTCIKFKSFFSDKTNAVILETSYTSNYKVPDAEM